MLKTTNECKIQRVIDCVHMLTASMAYFSVEHFDDEFLRSVLHVAQTASDPSISLLFSFPSLPSFVVSFLTGIVYFYCICSNICTLLKFYFILKETKLLCYFFLEFLRDMEGNTIGECIPEWALSCVKFALEFLSDIEERDWTANSMVFLPLSSIFCC
jgi:hypothetical protein